MNLLRGVFLAMGAITLTAGCGAALQAAGALQGDEVTVVLRNSSDDFDVEVTLFYDDDQNILEGVLTETGTQVDTVVLAGQSVTLTRDCDDLQAIIIEDADLLLIGELGPETDTDVLRDGDEFGCGDTLVFTFSHPDEDIPLDLNVTFTTE